MLNMPVATPGEFQALMLRWVAEENFKNAELVIEQGLSKFPKDPWLNYRRAELFVRAGERQRAAEAFEFALSLVKGNKPAQFVRGASLMANGFVEIEGVEVHVDWQVVSPGIQIALINGWYERRERDLLKQVVRPGDRILELGGGLGYLACSAAKLAEQVTCWMVEANPALVRLIERNLEKNACSGKVFSGAASVDERPVEFLLADDFWASSTVGVAGGFKTVEVSGVAIPKLIAELAPTVLIVDIEGGELGLLSALDLGCVERLVVEFHPDVYGHAGASQIIQHLLACGFLLNTKAAAGQVFLFQKTES